MTFATVDNIGSLGNAEGMVFELHDTGRHVKRSYGHTGRRNYYRANKVGLKLETITSYAEYDIYARYNSTAAIQIIDSANVTIRSGAIEGNHGKAIEVINGTATVTQLNLDDVYFEQNGDQANGVWSIDVPFDANAYVNVRGGHYWSNVASGITSGPYRFGPSLSMEGATINGQFYATEVTGFRNCRGPSPGAWNTMPTEVLSRSFGLTAPAIFHEFAPAAYELTFTSAATGGLIIGTRMAGRPENALPNTVNLVPDTYSYGMSWGGGAVTTTENTALNYGDGSFVKAQYLSSVGNFSTNYVRIGPDFTDTTKQFRVLCVLVKPEADCEMGIIQSGGGQASTGYYAFMANKTYRLVICGFAPMTASSSVRMFPLNTAGPAVNFLPLWASQHATYLDMLKTVEMLVHGAPGGRSLTG